MKEPSKSTVLKFPDMFDPTNPPNLEVARLTMQEIKTEFCRDTTEFVFEQTLAILNAFGYFITEEKTNHRDLSMLEEAIMSAVCRYSGVPHPLHELTDSITFNEDEEQDELTSESDEEQIVTA